ncbi:MAG: YjgN family protein [Hyphomicrobiales bacterium]
MTISSGDTRGATAAGSQLRFDYIPRPGLLGITLTNLFFNLITLTIYRFWARTNVRRHIWTCVHINGEPLEYTGRGIELFIGALIVFGVLILPIVLLLTALQIGLGQEHPAVFIVQFVFFLIIFGLWGMAVYRARRYQLSRTLWRGIRGALVGSPWSYTGLHAGASLLAPMTLGWSTPAMNLNLQERMIGDMRFGSMPFRFSGTAGPLYGRYAIAWSLAVVIFLSVLIAGGILIYLAYSAEIWTILSGSVAINSPSQSNVQESDIQAFVMIFGILGVAILAWLAQSLVWPIYLAREMAVFASYTTLDRARFRLDATAGSLLLLTIGNVLLWIFTIGIATPFIQQRTIKYMCDRLSVIGEVDIATILQSPAPVPRSGEGLADAFDVGGI